MSEPSTPVSSTPDSPERSTSRTRRNIAWAVAVVAMLVFLGYEYLSGDDRVAYPFAHHPLSERSEPLWQLSPDEFRAAAERDRQRVSRLHGYLEGAAVRAASIGFLRREDVENFSAAERREVRHLWWAFFEPLLELDQIKHRWQHWYGVDYIRHPELHSRAYALTYASLASQVNAGQALLDLVAGNERIQRLFDEAMPDQGLQEGSFTALRGRMTRSRDQGFIGVGGEWYDDWIASHVQGTGFDTLVETVRFEAESNVDAGAILQTLENKSETVQREAFVAWFPVQRDLATWFGDTRVAPADRRLIADAQLDLMRASMSPGDIIVERRNWYLSNIGLPGFWPHAALYVGAREDLERFDDVVAVTERFGAPFTTYLQRAHPVAWRALGERDHAGHIHRVLEAVSEGVVAASLEHSCGADYVAVLRPRLPPVLVALAIDRALAYFGRPYDFDFDFATDDTVVCSELVMKAYEPEAEDSPGLRVPFIEVAGRMSVPPTEIVRLFAHELGQEDAQLEFVYFLEGIERSHSAHVQGSRALAASADRPKWDLLQR